MIIARTISVYTNCVYLFNCNTFNTCAKRDESG